MSNNIGVNKFHCVSSQRICSVVSMIRTSGLGTAVGSTGIGFPRGGTRLVHLLSRVKRSSGPVVTVCGLGS